MAEPVLLEVVAEFLPESADSDAFEIVTGVQTLGRKDSNQIILKHDAYISGQHAELRADATGVILVDIGSTNGTFVNGDRLLSDTPHLLLDGDKVQFGQTNYAFRLKIKITPDESPLTTEEPV